MNKQQIRDMIEKYQIVAGWDDGLLHVFNKSLVTPEVHKQLVEAKPEILAYLAEERAAQRRKFEQERATFNAIPGVLQLREALAQWREYKAAFNAAFDNEDGIFPQAPSVDAKALAKKYPGAVFALKIESELAISNLELYGIAQDAFDKLCNGVPWEEVKQAYDAANKAFVERHTRY